MASLPLCCLSGCNQSLGLFSGKRTTQQQSAGKNSPRRANLAQVSIPRRRNFRFTTVVEVWYRHSNHRYEPRLEHNSWPAVPPCYFLSTTPLISFAPPPPTAPPSCLTYSSFCPVASCASLLHLPHVQNTLLFICRACRSSTPASEPTSSVPSSYYTF